VSWWAKADGRHTGTSRANGATGYLVETEVVDRSFSVHGEQAKESRDRLDPTIHKKGAA
jgi:hypothetical protein